MPKVLACACGEPRFRVRIQRDEQVGLLTCAAGHHSFLLDSEGLWDDVVQHGKPREKKCKCGGREFAVALAYAIDEDDGEVRHVEVTVQCVACQKPSTAATFEIDYTPTAPLIDTPLTPCTDPWIVPKRREFSSLWVPQDLEDVVRYLGETEHARCYFARFDQPVRLASAAEIGEALARERFFHLFFAARELALPAQLRDCWKSLPVIHVGSPMQINYSTGAATMYIVEWAEQFLVARQVVAQAPALLALAARLEAWCRGRFTSARGKRTFDNPAEYARLQGGW